MVDGQSTHDAMKYMSQNSWFRRGCDDPHEIKSWADLRLVQLLNFLEAGPELLKYAPWPMGLIAR